MATDQEIAERAHQIWIAKGKPHGQDEQDWIDAQAELEGQPDTDFHEPSGYRIPDELLR